MPTRKNAQRLELTWPGKHDRPQLEPRILLEDASKSYHAKAKVTDADQFDNRLIFGDNLLALKALEAEFAGQVKCIFIDPPYNTGSAFEHYDDAVEHTIWLRLMRERLEILKRLMRPDGFLIVHIDDSEGHYLKTLCDEVFGRANFMAAIYIQVRYAEKTLKQDMAFHKQIEYSLAYRASRAAKPNQPKSDSGYTKFKYFIKELAPGKEIELGSKKVTLFQKNEYEIVEQEGSRAGLKEIWASGSILDGNSSGRFFRDHLTGRSELDGLGALYKVPDIGDDQFDFRYFTGPKRKNATKGKYYQGVPLSKLDSDSTEAELPIANFHDMAADFGNCRHEGGVEFRSGKKPERLIELMFQTFSSPGDLVLDSFAGSGTTGAVAHKLGRRWIMVELGEHCHTHIIPRMQKVIDGADPGGVTAATGWQGGGGFRYYKLAPSLLEKDGFGNWVISKTYNPAMLAEALCRHMGFDYAPSQTVYWQHGKSSETDFLYVTTAALSHTQLEEISREVGPQRSLLICAKAFEAEHVAQFENLTVHKIPAAVLHRCEWGQDDYSLAVRDLPQAEQDEPQGPEQASLLGDDDATVGADA